MKQIIIVLVALMATSCAYHGGMITSTPNFQNGKKVEYVDIATGYSKVSYFLGMGGMGKEALINQAKRNIYATYPLKPGQSFENMTINEKTTIFFPFVKKEILAVADVAQRDTMFSVTYSTNYLSMTTNPSDNLSFFKENEAVVIYDRELNTALQGRIIRCNNTNAKVFVIFNSGACKNKTYGLTNVFKKEQPKSFGDDIMVGDSVMYTKITEVGKLTQEGKVIGINSTKALIVSGYGTTTLLLNKLTKIETK